MFRKGDQLLFLDGPLPLNVSSGRECPTRPTRTLNKDNSSKEEFTSICNCTNLSSFQIKQEAHGPHSSPEKTIQINTYDYIITLIKRRKERFFNFSSMYFHYFVIISPWKRGGSFICTNLNPLHPRMPFAKFD